MPDCCCSRRNATWLVMVFTVFLLTITAVLPLRINAATDDVPEDIFLLIGQSNMLGCAPITPLDLETLPGALLFNGRGWEPLRASVQRYSTALPTPGRSNLGPGYTFARKLSEVTGRKIGIVANARGGTRIAWWQKGYTGENDYDLYEKAVAQARLALEKTPNARLAGILWHQGEGDNSASGAAEYIERLQTLISDLRRDLNAPDAIFIAGEVGTWNGRGTQVNPQIRKAEEVIDNMYWVSSAGLVPLLQADGTPDLTDPHFNTLSQRVLGERYADKALTILYGLSPGVATLYAANELFDGLRFTGYSTTLPIGDYDKQALERRGIDVTKLASVQVESGYDVILRTTEGSVVVVDDTASLHELVPPGSIQAVSVAPSPIFARVSLLEHTLLLALNQKSYQLQLPFGVTKAPAVEVTLLDTTSIQELADKQVSIEVVQPTTLPDTVRVRTLDQSGTVVHEADIRLTVAPLPNIDVMVGVATLPIKTQTVVLRGSAALRVTADGPAELLAGCEAILTPTNTELPEIVWYSGTQLPQEAQLDTLTVADGFYILTVKVTTLAGSIYELNQSVRVHNWNKQNDELQPITVSDWFGAINPRLTVSESEGWHSFVDDPEHFCGDRHRLAGGQDDYLIWEVQSAEKYILTLYAIRPEQVPSVVEVAVSPDMVTWQALDYAIAVSECVAPVGGAEKWRQMRLTGELMPESDQMRYIRVFMQSGSDPAQEIQLGSMELWTPVTQSE
ncbi:MAG: sialate O-acetylesterase [Limnochordia bacterium]|jgi:hypothetical protein